MFLGMRLVLASLLIATTAAADPAPDPITKPLTEQEARSEASRLAREAFVKRKDLKKFKTPDFAADAFIVKHDNKRWTLNIDPPAGGFARVSFGDFGDHAKVDVGFATK